MIDDWLLSMLGHVLIPRTYYMQRQFDLTYTPNFLLGIFFSEQFCVTNYIFKNNEIELQKQMFSLRKKLAIFYLATKSFDKHKTNT